MFDDCLNLAATRKDGLAHIKGSAAVSLSRHSSAQCAACSLRLSRCCQYLASLSPLKSRMLSKYANEEILRDN